MQQKTSAGRVFFFLLLAPLMGCPSSSAVVTKSPPAFQGVQLTVACPSKSIQEVVETYSRNWAEQQGVKVRTLLYDVRTTPTPPDADLWIIPAVALPRLAHDHLIQPLPNKYTSEQNQDWKGLLPLYREQVLVWDQMSYGFPLLGEAPVCCCRDDWFADKQHQSAFADKYHHKLALPQTWEHYADLAEYFHDHGSTGKPSASLPPLPGDDDELEHEFYTIAAGYVRRAIVEGSVLNTERQEEVYSFHYDLNTGKPRIAAPGFVYALKLMKERLQPCRPVGTSAAPAKAFRDGQAVLCLTQAAHIAAFQNGAVRDQYSIGRMPGAGQVFEFHTGKESGREVNRMPYLGADSWLTVVPKKATAADAAFALAAELCGPEVSRQIVLEPQRGGGPIRLAHLEETKGWEAFNLDAVRTAALRDALRETLQHPSIRNPALRLRTPDEATHRAILVKELRSVLEGTAEPAAALELVAERWSELDRRQDAATHRAEYRISLGLLP